MAKRDFLTGIAIYRSNSKHLIGKPNRSTNDTKIKEWVEQGSIRILAGWEWNWGILVITFDETWVS